MAVPPGVRGEEKCAETRLDSAGGPLFGVPVAFQRNLDICYAAVAAQLMDAHLRTYSGYRELKPTSPLTVAVNYKLSSFMALPAAHFLHVPLGFGSVPLALRENLDHGSCGSIDQKAYDHWEERLAKLEASRALKSASLEFQSWFQSAAQLHIRRSELMDEWLAEARRSLPLGPLPAQSPMHGLKSVLDERCAGETIPIRPGYRVVHKSGLEVTIEDIQARLSGSRPRPVAIGYCKRFLSEGKACGKKKIPEHASVIIGRRMNGRTCEFLVRDSLEPWTATSEFEVDRPGQYWIPAWRLYENLAETVWLECDDATGCGR